MKCLRSFLFANIIFAFMLSTSSLFGQTDCFPNEFGCTDIANFTETVTIPNYPGCEITVNYDLRICQGVSQIANLTVTAIPFGDPECGSLLSDIIGVIFGGDQLATERFLTTFFAAVETSLSDLLWQQTLDISIANGTTALLSCEKGITTFTASFYRGSCVSFCFGRDEETGALQISQISCGTTCCRKNISYCLGPDGEVVIEESTEQVNDGECFQFELPQCPEGNLFQSPCFELCEPN